ncbi:MAG: C40 family peptidase [Actinobacteria bacterium]|nr:C40 family peptidase [Actinomycetota bacterium]MBW3649169.1 C40 family peptidase [Actinomycetota bacterium]
MPTVFASPAAGDPISEKKEEAARIARELEQQSRRVSMLAEDYDEARVRIAGIAEEVAAARVKVSRTDEQVGRIKRRLKEQSVQAYIRGGSSQALELLINTRSTEELAVRTQYVMTVTAGSVETLDELRSVRLRLQDQQQVLDQAQAEAAAMAAVAERKRQEAAAAEATQRETLAKVQGELAGLVAAEAQRRAEEEARRAQAELAARRARQEADAREAAAREAAAREAAARARATPATTAAPASPSGTIARATTTTLRPPTTTTTTKPPAAGGGSGSAPPPSAGADAAIAEARRQIGKPYEWGASGPDSFDCSGLTLWSWRAGGKSLPHSSRAQWSATSRVDITDIKPGDLLFYGDPIHHVGLYIGNGQMIEASQTGTPVRYASIYRSDYTGAGRVN